MVRARQVDSWLRQLITITHELGKLQKKLGKVQKQIPFATAKALTATGQKVKAAEVAEMKKVFDRPTRFTLNSLFLRPATKQRLYAKVWLRDWAPKGTPATKYLSPQIEGGRRKLKGFEVLLNRKGVLPDGYYVVPSRKAKKDAHGNINKGLLNQVLSYAGAQRDRAQNTKQGRARQTKARFVVLDENNGKPGGIWQLDANQNLYPILIFVRQPSYRIALDFHGVAAKVMRANFDREMSKALDHALRTAK